MESMDFKAADGLTIRAWKEVPENAVAIMQLVHGSLEYSERYRPFIEYLLEHGIGVYRMDLRGHGHTGDDSGQMNIFSMKSSGWEFAIGDLMQQREQIQIDHPDLPVFILGHSMGSFLSRDLISRTGSSYKGAVLSGTGRATPLLTYSGLLLAKLFKALSRNKPNAMLHNMVYGELNKKISNPRTDYDFLCRDEAVVDAYIADPWCGNIITAEYGHELVTGVLRINSSDCYRNTPGDLPILLFSGEKDPVGGIDASYVREVADLYRKFGKKNVTVQIYPGGRHEMLNETNKKDVWQDVIAWMGVH